MERKIILRTQKENLNVELNVICETLCTQLDCIFFLQIADGDEEDGKSYNGDLGIMV